MASAVTYLKNIAKSFGYTASDIFKEYNPVVTSMASTAKEASVSGYEAIKDFIYDKKSVAEQNLDGDNSKSIVNTLWKNIKDDLKHGTWYNKQRQEAMSSDLAKAMGMDFDFDLNFDDWGEDDFGDSDTQAQIDSDQQNTKSVILSMDMVGKQVAGAVSEATAASANYIVSASRESSRALYNLNQKGFSQVTQALATVNSSIAGFAAIGKPLTEHMQNSFKFFASTTETLKNIDKNIAILVKNTTPPSKKDVKYGKGGLDSILDSNGALNLSAYKEMIKDNIKDYKDLYDMGRDYIKQGGGIKNMLKNISPLQIIMTSMFRGYVDKTGLGKSMENFNKELGKLFGGLLVRARQAAKDKGGLFGEIAGLFLPKDNYKDKINNSKYDKGPVPWDGVARRALTTVIPNVLFDIYAAITHTAPSRYDYNKGVVIRNAKKTLQALQTAEIENAATRAGGEFRTNVIGRLSTKRQQDQAKKAFVELFTSNRVPSLKDLDKYDLDPEVRQAFEKAIIEGYANGYLADRDRERNAMGDRYRSMEAEGMSPLGYLDDLNSMSTNVEVEFTTTYSRGKKVTKVKKKNKSNVSPSSKASAAEDKIIGATSAADRRSDIDNDYINSVLNDDSEEESELSKEAKGIKGKLQRLFKIPKALAGLFDVPFKAAANLLDNLSKSMNGVLFGKNGVLDTLKENIKSNFSKMFGDLRDRFKDTFDRLFGGTSAGDFFKDAKQKTKNTFKDIGRSLASFVGLDIEPQQAYRGRKITRTGIAAVSAGELIIPAEFNPFYHGHVNKREENRKERKAINQFYGAFYKGTGSVGRESETLSSDSSKSGSKSDDDGPGVTLKIRPDSLLGLIGGSIKDGAKKVAAAVMNFFGDPKKDKEATSDVMKKLQSEFKETTGGIGAGALIGAGTSALTGLLGGPLLGAAVGAGIGYIAKSKAAQDLLFGEMEVDKDGKPIGRKGGLISKDMSNFLTKNVPSMAKGGAVGAIGGLFMGSPIMGAVLGSTVGYITSSESAKTFLFGKMEVDENGNPTGRAGGLISKELQKSVKKAAPNMAIGGIIGMLTGSPFGILGGAVMGSAVGLLTSTDKFHKWFFGDPDDKSTKGLLPTLQEKLFGHLVELFANIGNALKGVGRKLLNDTKLLLSAAVGKLTDFAKKTASGDSLLGKGLRGAGKVANALTFGAINKVGGITKRLSTFAKRSNLKHGYDVYDKRAGRNLTAEERLGLRSEIGGWNGANETFGKFDQILAGVQTEEEMDQLIKDLERAGNGSAESQKVLEALNEQELKLNKGNLVSAIGLAKSEKATRKLLSPEAASLQNLETMVSKIVSKITGEKIATTADGRMKSIFNASKEDKAKYRTEYNQFTNSVVELRENSDGSVDVDNTDKETSSVTEKMKAFFHSVIGLPSLFGKIGSWFGGLFGKNKDDKGEKKETFLDKIKNFLFGSEGFSLKNLITNIVGPALGVALLAAGFGGKFDGLFAKLGEIIPALRGNESEGNSTLDDNRSMTVTLSDGSKREVKLDSKGNILKDANGNYIAVDGSVVTKEEVSNYQSAGEDTRFSTLLKKNTINGLMTGGGSVASHVVKKAVNGIKNAVSLGGAKKLATEGAKDLATSPAMAKGVMATISSLLEKIPAILRKIPFLPASVADNADTIVTTLYTHLDDAVKGLGPKLANVAKALKSAFAVAQVVYIAGVGINAWGDAASILGITDKPTVGQRVIATLIAVVNALIPVIGNLIPNKVLVNIFMEIAPKIGIDVSELADQRQRAKEEVDAYNEANGTTYTLEEYNLAVKGNAGIITKAKHGIKSFMTHAKEKGIGSALSSTKIGQAVGNVVTGIKESKIGQGAIGLATQTAQLLKMAIKGDLTNLWGVRPEEDEDNPLTGVNKAICTVQKILLTPITLVSLLGHKIWDGLKALGTGIKNSFIAIGQNQIEIAKMTAAGDLEGLWSRQPEDNPDNPLNGIMKGINIVQSVFATPITAVSWLGHKIWDGVKAVGTGIKNSFISIGTNEIEIKKKALEGDISGMWELEPEDNPDNPLNGMMKGIDTFQKVYNTPLASMSWLGHKIWDGVKALSEPIVKDQQTLNGSREVLAKYADEGDVGSIWNEQGPEFNSFMKGLYSFSFFTSKIGYTISALFKKLFGWIGDIWDKFKNSELVQKVTNSEFFQNVKQSASDFGSGIKQAWNWVTGGGASGIGEHVSQYDTRYKDIPMSGSTFGEKGCGPAVASMAASAYGKDLPVKDAIKLSQKYQNNDGVSVDYFKEALGSRGISTNYVKGAPEIVNQLASGHQVILLGSDAKNTSKARSPFGPSKHYVLARGFDKSGRIVVQDPESSKTMLYNPTILKSASLGIQAGGAGNYDTSNARQVWAYFKNQGYSNAAIAGLMGNLYQESHLDPAIIQGGGKGPAAGIAQWENYNTKESRWLALSNFAKARGKNWTDLNTQLAFLHEKDLPAQNYYFREGSRMSPAGASFTTVDQWKQSPNTEAGVEMATRQFEGGFERAGKPNMANRIKMAKEYYNLYSGSDVKFDPNYISPTSISDSTSSSGGEEKITFANILSSIGGIFSKIFGALSGNSGSTDSISGASLATGPITLGNAPKGKGNPMQKKLVQYARSIIGRDQYSQDGSLRGKVGQGYSDCSSFAQWVYKQGLNVDPGSYTGAQIKSNQLVAVDSGTVPNVANLEPGDLMFYKSNEPNGRDYNVGHVEVYSGENTTIGHGSGIGPQEQDLSGYVNWANTHGHNYIMSMRYKDIAKYNSGNPYAGTDTYKSYQTLLNQYGTKNTKKVKATASTKKNYVSADNFSGGRSGIRRLRPSLRAMSGGASSLNRAMTGATTSMLNNIAANVSSNGSISGDLLQQLITAIIELLTAIANNTAPVEKIYTALSAYGEVATKKANTKQDVQKNVPEDVDSNIKALAGTLAALAKG